jgi:hypothetical protein
MKQQIAQEIDTELARLHMEGQLDARQRKILMERLHRVTGDMQTHDLRGRSSWQDTDEQSVERAERMLADGRDNDLRHGPGVICRTMKALVELAEEQRKLASQIFRLERLYRADPWNRYYLVTNANGHVHKDMSCPSCFLDTSYEWLVKLAAQPVDEMINDYGEKACTICFPDAPANPKHKEPGRIDREAQAARDAEKAAKEDAKMATNLRKDEQFRDYMNWTVKTVAGARKALRDEVEMRHYSGIDDHHLWWPASVVAAARAREVLLARGVPAKELDKIVANAEKRQRKLFA